MMVVIVFYFGLNKDKFYCKNKVDYGLVYIIYYTFSLDNSPIKYYGKNIVLLIYTL